MINVGTKCVVVHEDYPEEKEEFFFSIVWKYFWRAEKNKSLESISRAKIYSRGTVDLFFHVIVQEVSLFYFERTAFLSVPLDPHFKLSLHRLRKTNSETIKRLIHRKTEFFNSF